MWCHAGRRQSTPTDRRILDLKLRIPDPGTRSDKSWSLRGEAGGDNATSNNDARGRSSRSGYKVGSRRSSVAVLPKGGCQEQARVFFRRFPSSSIGIYFLHAFYSHTHRMWGSIDNRGTTADRGRRKGGGRTGSQGSKWGSTSMVTCYHAHKMRWFRYHPRPAISRTNPMPSH